MENECLQGCLVVGDSFVLTFHNPTIEVNQPLVFNLATMADGECQALSLYKGF